MYKKKKGAVQEVGFGEDSIKVNLPPKGYVYDPETGELEKSEILFQHKPKKDQCWERLPLPKDYKHVKTRFYDLLDKHVPSKAYEILYDEYPKFGRYINQEWNRRLKGLWFMNNGKPTYITGLHYMYLQWWRIDIGYVNYREPDRQSFYFLQYCLEDPECLGMLEMTKRKQGKTYRAGLFAYEYVTRTNDAHAGIQSQNFKEARDTVYKKSLMRPFKYLPFFFVPTYDTTKGMPPESGIEFKMPANRSKKMKDYDPDEELNSFISYGTAEIAAYDGPRLHRYVADECGKTFDVPISARHDTVKYATVIDNVIGGKFLYTTTVEKDENKAGEGKPNESFRELWDNSNPHNKGKDGRTSSGLYRYFTSYEHALYFDKYGFPDVKYNIEIHDAEVEKLRGQPARLNSFLRKNPRNPDDAFRVDSGESIFNQTILHERLRYLEKLPEDKTPYRRGKLEWQGEKYSSPVTFIPDENGRFLISYIPDKDNLNRVEKGRKGWTPRNNSKFRAATDPIAQQDSTEAKPSMAAGMVFRLFDQSVDGNQEMEGWESHNVCCLYLGRPDALVYYDDMIKMCHFYGCSIHIESQGIGRGAINYFLDHEHKEFLMWRPEHTKTTDNPISTNQNTIGTGNSNEAMELMLPDAEHFVDFHGHRIPFPELIKQLRDFEFKNRRHYDLGVCFIYLMAGVKHRIDEGPKTVNLNDYLDVFDASGMKSKAIE